MGREKIQNLKKNRRRRDWKRVRKIKKSKILLQRQMKLMKNDTILER